MTKNMTSGTSNQPENDYDGNNEVRMNVVSPMISGPERLNRRLVGGVLLCIAGGLVLAGQVLHLQWLTCLAPLSSGVVLLVAGIYSRQRGYLISGSIVSGLGIGFYMVVVGLPDSGILARIGVALISLSIGFAGVSAFIWLIYRKFAWWALIVSVPVGAVGVVLSFSKAGPLDFILYVVSGTGLTLLGIGVTKKWIGLIIPGCLMIGLGPGVSLAWGGLGHVNLLTQTGVMLVWFAFGWGLITLFSRIVIEKFVWWPLIPGGIIGMVGWGLYIGGNPGNAVNFIGNTGSIVIIIFGVYLLLMRRGIRR
jgi:hypothetical protein